MKSLRVKVGSSFGVLVVVTIAVTVFAVSHFENLGSSVDQILRENYRSVLAAENMVKELERQENARLRYLAGDSASALVAFQKHRDQFWSWYGEAIVGIALPEEPALVETIEVVYDQYLVASDSLFRSVGAKDSAARERWETEVSAYVTDLRSINLLLLEVNQDAIHDIQRRVESLAARATRTSIIAAILALALCLLTAVYVIRTFVRPVEQLTRSVRQIGAGNLDLHVDIRTNDEVEELGREFNQMSNRLQAYEALNVQHLIAEKRKSESLVETIPNPVIVTDEDSKVLLLNQAATEALSIGENAWFGRPLADVVSDTALLDQLTHEPTRAQSASPETGPASGEGHVFAVDAATGPRYYLRRHRLVRLDDGQGLHVTVLEDVTRFKELDQLKSDLLAAVSHELRTPLTSLGMAIDLLLREVPDPITEAQRELLAAAREDQARLKKLVSNLLDLARLESGAYVPKSEPLRVQAVLDESLAPLELPFNEKGVWLDTLVEHGAQSVLGDAQHLGWVLSNLAGNALRHTPSGGRVSVRVQRDDREIHFSVHDTGSGIPPDELERIFDMFVQLKPSDETTPGSLGLGLALARRVVQAHGGRIWAENGPAAGSTFHFTIPAGA